MKRFDRRKKKREKNLGVIIMVFLGILLTLPLIELI